MLDELTDCGLVPPLVGTDAGYGEVTEFRQGLDDRQIAYVVQLKQIASALPERIEREQPAYGGTGRHFEGRSYRGWHHHVTLVSVAHAFLTLARRRPSTRAAA